MNFYVSLFADGEILDMAKYGPGQAGPDGSVIRASFRIAKQTIICIDSPIKHAFTFTPAFSLFVDCENEHELERLYAALLGGGMAMMPLDNYGFSRRFGWISYRFGVSWQLNLP